MTDGSDELKVVLIGNYPHDGQESMRRFAMLMLDGLTNAGVAARLLVPRPFFGRLRPGGSGFGKWLGYLDKFALFPRELKRELAGCKGPAVVHICDHSNAFYARRLQGIPHLVTCHDLLAVRSALGEISENPTRWSGRCLQAMILRGLRHAGHVACVSETTRRDVCRLADLPSERVSVVLNALNHPYAPMEKSRADEMVGALFQRAGHGNRDARRGFLLHVGGNQWYKNRIGVLRIHARLAAADPAAPVMVMAGKTFTEDMREFVKMNALDSSVFEFQFCTGDELCALYSIATALVFPSLAEGFGWPVIEAQACGCPVVCSSVDPFPEISGGAALMCEPCDEAGFAQAILRLRQAGVREALVEKGFVNARRFTPERMMQEYIATYRSVAGVIRHENAFRL